MFFKPDDTDIYALALSLESGLLSNNQESLNIAFSSVDRYCDYAMRSLSENNMILPLTPKTISRLKPVELWALNFLAVKKILESNKANELPYLVICALNHFRDKFPGNESQMEKLTAVDITNIVFATEFDLIFAIHGIEFMIAYYQVINNK